eukprot:2731435-Prymnesium_polylepis.1
MPRCEPPHAPLTCPAVNRRPERSHAAVTCSFTCHIQFHMSHVHIMSCGGHVRRSPPLWQGTADRP